MVAIINTGLERLQQNMEYQTADRGPSILFLPVMSKSLVFFVVVCILSYTFYHDISLVHGQIRTGLLPSLLLALGPFPPVNHAVIYRNTIGSLTGFVVRHYFLTTIDDAMSAD